MKLKKKNCMIAGLILVVLITLITIIIVNVNKKDPVELTKEYMENFQKLDKNIVKNIKYDFDDNLTKKQEENYNSVMKRQYENIEYNITNETINKTDAIIKVEFEVYDLSSEMDRANSYIEVYNDKFLTNNKFDISKAIDYKLKSLNKCQTRITYSIDFSFYKEKGKWKMSELNEIDLKKINGTY